MVMRMMTMTMMMIDIHIDRHSSPLTTICLEVYKGIEKSDLMWQKVRKTRPGSLNH